MYDAFIVEVLLLPMQVLMHHLINPVLSMQQNAISKRGSSQLRKLCFEVMMALKLKPPKEDTAVYDFMLKKEAEGKAKMVAKVAAMNKFLRI